MKGKRTILFNLAMAVIGLAGIKISPDTVNAWLDLFIPAWAIGGLLLRQLTNTPVFQREVASLGLPPDLISAITDAAHNGAADSSRAWIANAVNGLNEAVGKLDGHPLADPATLATLTEALDKLTTGDSPLAVADPSGGSGNSAGDSPPPVAAQPAPQATATPEAAPVPTPA